MKLYFAKYLPIEGEIKDGDFYLFEGKINQCKKSIIPELKELYCDKWDNTLYQRVSLFLCSRDIQVGDKVFCLDVHINNPLHPPERYIDPWRIRSEGDTCKACIKVIGEISPEATWVKEGDEFDEKEIHIAGFLKTDTSSSGWWNNSYKPYSEEMLKEGNGIWANFVMIECPVCKKFH